MLLHWWLLITLCSQNFQSISDQTRLITTFQAIDLLNPPRTSHTRAHTHTRIHTRIHYFLRCFFYYYLLIKNMKVSSDVIIYKFFKLFPLSILCFIFAAIISYILIHYREIHFSNIDFLAYSYFIIIPLVEMWHNSMLKALPLNLKTVHYWISF